MNIQVTITATCPECHNVVAMASLENAYIEDLPQISAEYQAKGLSVSIVPPSLAVVVKGHLNGCSKNIPAILPCPMCGEMPKVEPTGAYRHIQSSCYLSSIFISIADIRKWNMRAKCGKCADSEKRTMDAFKERYALEEKLRQCRDWGNGLEGEIEDCKEKLAAAKQLLVAIGAPI